MNILKTKPEVILDLRVHLATWSIFEKQRVGNNMHVSERI